LSDYAGIVVYTYDVSRIANEASSQHRDVTEARTYVENMLTWANSRIAKEPLCDRIEDCGLPNQPLVFCICATEQVGKESKSSPALLPLLVIRVT
jgi:hypothetical protein